MGDMTKHSIMLPSKQRMPCAIEYRAASGDTPETFTASLSSEYPVDRGGYVEVLDHSPQSIDLSRAVNGIPLLFGHDAWSAASVVGRGENLRIEGGKLRADLRFFSTPEAQRVATMVREGHREMSISYTIDAAAPEPQNKSIIHISRWSLLEASIVSVPADPTVGVNRTMPEMPAPLLQKEHAMPDVSAPAVAEMPDIVAIENTAALGENTRVRNILTMGEQFGYADMAREAIASRMPEQEFKDSLIKRLADTKRITPAESPDIGLSEREKRGYSFCRAMMHVLEPYDEQIRRGAAFEIECSQAAKAKRLDGKKERECALTIPSDMLSHANVVSGDALASAVRMYLNNMARRDLTAGTANAGGYTMQTDVLAASFIELLRNKMIVNQLGTRVLTGLSGNVSIPSQTGGATAYWVAENGAPTESQQTLGQLALTPKTVGAFTDYSRRLLLQSSIDVETFVRMDLATVIAIAIDLAAITGTGASNQPTGILSTAGIGSVPGGTNGAPVIWDHFVDLETAVAVGNADVGALHYLTNTKVRGKCRKTQQFATTNGKDLWAAVSDMYGPPGVTNQVPYNLTKGTSAGVCSAIIFGNFNDLIVGMWGGLDLMVDQYAGSTAGTKRVIALQDCDVGVRHAASFAAMLDALTA